MRHGRCDHLTHGRRYADEIWKSKVDDLRAPCEEAVKERKGEPVRLWREWRHRQEIRNEC
jgi:hypothetical protein